jgi:hypothetical protein
MNRKPTFRRGLRLFLDCMVIALILLIASPARLPGMRSTAHAASPATRLASPLAPLDSITAAGLMAAEDAALTEPIFFVDLPITVH